MPDRGGALEQVVPREGEARRPLVLRARGQEIVDHRRKRIAPVRMIFERGVHRVGMAAKAAKKRTPTKKSAKRSEKPAKSTPARLLSGGNPQIAKADGDAPVQAFIAAMPGWKRELGRRLDALIVRNAPQVRKAVRWNSPFYGIEGQGWIVSYHVFQDYVKVTFFNGLALRPPPPGGTQDPARWVNIREGELDEAQMAAWVKQAATLPGWGKVGEHSQG